MPYTRSRRTLGGNSPVQVMQASKLGAVAGRFPMLQCDAHQTFFDAKDVGKATVKLERDTILTLGLRLRLVMFWPGLASKPQLWPGLRQLQLAEILSQAMGHGFGLAMVWLGLGHSFSAFFSLEFQNMKTQYRSLGVSEG